MDAELLLERLRAAPNLNILVTSREALDLYEEWLLPVAGLPQPKADDVPEGVWVFSTQFCQFGEEPGAETLVSREYELTDLSTEIARAITGGTGEYSTADGEAVQTLLGFNASEDVTLQAERAVAE